MSSESGKEDCLGYAARDSSGFLSPYKFSRRAVGSDDVSITITHCGLSHVEVLWTRNKLFGNAIYPLVPGHEIVGVVREVGPNVKSFKVGDHAGVGTYVNTCRDCEYCNDGFEVHCSKGRVSTYNRVDVDGTVTKGGFSSYIVVHERALKSDDISIDITYCGVCYAEVVWTRNKFGDAKYPVVPGHEIVGVVREVGPDVKGFKVGDHVGVGTYVNSCRDCEYCNEGVEVHCSKGAVYTYNHVDVDGTITKGGFSNYIVVHERYCFKIPENYPLASAGPLLCAGITVYYPMIRHKMNQPGKSLGVVGLGGLGHLAVKFGKAFGLNVTVFSTSVSKREEALNLLGADKFVISSNEEEMKAASNSLDFIIDSASGTHPFDPYMSLLKTGGVLVLVGAPSEVKLSPISLILGMKTISGSAVGGTKDVREMLDFCAANKIYPEIEIIPIQYVNKAIERLIRSDIKYRFVIDIENSLK